MCSWLYSMELFERTSSVPSKSHIYSVASRRVRAEGACAMSAVEALGGVVCIVGTVGTVGTVLESMSQSVANNACAVDPCVGNLRKVDGFSLKII